MVRVNTTSESSASISGAVARRHLLSAGVRVPLYLQDNVSFNFNLFYWNHNTYISTLMHSDLGQMYLHSETNRYTRNHSYRGFN